MTSKLCLPRSRHGVGRRTVTRASSARSTADDACTQPSAAWARRHSRRNSPAPCQIAAWRLSGPKGPTPMRF